jgi:predicted DNA-binding protein
MENKIVIRPKQMQRDRERHKLIRVKLETHKRLRELAEHVGRPIGEVADEIIRQAKVEIS